MQSAAVIVILMLCSILIINLIRTVFYFDYRITKKNGSLLLWFVKYKSTILKPEVQIVTVTRNYFQRKNEYFRD
jgi:putative membrane protein